ncbi:DUF378 domain-containing protein [Candidatus Cerribacteria bacterium 'Amazon FNV 2010 28 9']|uniref:DUF378 domain-containing protein n=1 Tax=Candidatus Cerribacteria bacterium 'Amazon FNV 2010 28 9' TaxID=2081795 RepID=A0A317JQL4_9BACT|nr:MAG: DUF378 domain-containing protein [Candidatus Cerribacteria bacterium 'Amazon FNV 2010 28 9']
MGGMFWLHALSFLLVIVGGLNWGLVGIANINLVHWIFGAWPMVEQIIYVLVGLGAVYLIFTHKNDCKSCSMMMK